jgi:hypothetical protein
MGTVKYYLRRYGWQMRHGPELEEDLLIACATAVTPKKTRGWFRNSGYIV